MPDSAEENDRAACPESGDCPVPETHSRLQEAHHLWHEAERTYADPEFFRVYLNACIQALRNVTFVLQKQKARIPNFDRWYSSWQERMRQDSVLKWLVQARNRIVKEGDLETKSTARVAIIKHYLEPPFVELDVDPLKSTEQIASELASHQMPEGLRSQALLRVDRRWVACDLPEWELLDALAHAYGVLGTLVNDAHRQCGIQGTKAYIRMPDGTVSLAPESTDHLGGRLPCMVTSEDTRGVWVDLVTGKLVVLTSTTGCFSVDDFEEARARYNLPKDLGRTASRGSELRSRAEFFFQYAKAILCTDGFHVPIALLIQPNGRPSIHSLKADSRTDYFVLWRNIAAQVQRLGADTVIAISEAWMAPYDPSHPARSATDSPNRIEVLDLHAAALDGKEVALFCEILRKDGAIVLGETQEPREGRAAFLDPVQRVWAKWRSDKDANG